MGLADLTVQIFADGANLDDVARLARHPLVYGFTTNPSLMAKAGVPNYKTFARTVLDFASNRPVSFEVLADDLTGMAEQARVIAGWGRNVNVKIPICNSLGESTIGLIRQLSEEGLALNVTAVFTLVQVVELAGVLRSPSIVSVFAGRIADTGVDPIPHMMEARHILDPGVQLLWASTREILNIFHADSCGCDIITVPSEMFGKLDLVGKNLDDYSRETAAMFYRDAAAVGGFL